MCRTRHPRVTAPAFQRSASTNLTYHLGGFVRFYLANPDPADAYVKAGYDVKDEVTAASAGQRLLSRVAILQAIEEGQLARMKRLDLDADAVVLRYYALCLRTLRDGEYGVACMALRDIGKTMGIFQKHQEGKREPTEADIEKLKKELE